MAFEQQPFGLMGLGARQQDSRGVLGAEGALSACGTQPLPHPHAPLTPALLNPALARQGMASR